MLICLFVNILFLFISRKHRLDKIRDYRWEKGSILSDDTKALLSKGEIEYFKKYDQVLSTYMQRTGFDLTAVFIESKND